MKKKMITMVLLCMMTVSAKAQVYAYDSYMPMPVRDLYDPQVMSMALAHAEMAARVEAKRQEMFEIYANKAIEAYNNDQWRDAVYYANGAFETTYYNADLYFVRGNAYEHLGDFRQAKKDYKKAKKYGNSDAAYALEALKARMKRK